MARAALELVPLRGGRLQLGFIDERNHRSLVQNQRQTGTVEWRQSLGEHLKVTTGFDHRHFEDLDNDRQIRSNLLTAALDWKPVSRLQAGVRREQNLGTADPTYPSQTLLTGSYRVSDFSRLFFTQRLASAPILPIGDLSRAGFASLMSRRETRMGVETRLKQSLNFTSRYQIENGVNGTDRFAVIGLINRLPVSETLSADLGWKSGIRVTGTTGSYKSAIAGFSWLPNGRLRASSRYELRGHSGFGHILTSGGAGRISESLTTLLQFQHTRGDFLGQHSQATQAGAAFALRPVRSDRAGVLFS